MKTPNFKGLCLLLTLLIFSFVNIRAFPQGVEGPNQPNVQTVSGSNFGPSADSTADSVPSSQEDLTAEVNSTAISHPEADNIPVLSHRSDVACKPQGEEDGEEVILEGCRKRLIRKLLDTVDRVINAVVAAENSLKAIEDAQVTIALRKHLKELLEDDLTFRAIVQLVVVLLRVLLALLIPVLGIEIGDAIDAPLQEALMRALIALCKRQGCCAVVATRSV